MERGHRARRSTRDRARWRGGAAAELPEIRFRACLCQHPLRRHRRSARGAASPSQRPSHRAERNPLADVEAYDATLFPAPRPAFLRAWIGAPGHVGRAVMRDGRLAGWGVIRPSRKGRQIGPFVADDRAAAEVVLSALLAGAGSGEIFLDVPGINHDAVALAQDLGLAPVFETARMYTGAIRRCGSSGYSASPAFSWDSSPGSYRSDIRKPGRPISGLFPA